MKNNKMFQVSTLQALALGYTKSVITVKELLEMGNIGLGTFEAVDGEMIVLDGHCYQAKHDGSVAEASLETGVPFCAVSFLNGGEDFEIDRINNISDLKLLLDSRIDNAFELNSMHIVRIDGCFEKVMARSESGRESRHVELKDLLKDNQTDFVFENTDGTLVCVYFPDYMDGINAPGWHLHFVSGDRTVGGHVFDVQFDNAKAVITKINTIEIKLPDTIEFDTYALKEASNNDIKKVEQGE